MDKVEKNQIIDVFITLMFMVTLIVMAVMLLAGQTQMAINASYIGMVIALASFIMWIIRRYEINKILSEQITDEGLN